MISVIIPCCNEQETLPYENIERVAGVICSILLFNHEIFSRLVKNI